MIDLIKKRRLWYTISLIIIGIGFGTMLKNTMQHGSAFNLGIDFTGGSTLTLRTSSPLPNGIESKLGAVIRSAGFEKLMIQMSESSIFTIKTQELTVEERGRLLASVESLVGDFELLEVSK